MNTKLTAAISAKYFWCKVIMHTDEGLLTGVWIAAILSTLGFVMVMFIFFNYFNNKVIGKLEPFFLSVLWVLGFAAVKYWCLIFNI